MWFRIGEDPPLEREFWKIKDNPMVVMRKESFEKDNIQR